MNSKAERKRLGILVGIMDADRCRKLRIRIRRAKRCGYAAEVEARTMDLRMIADPPGVPRLHRFAHRPATDASRGMEEGR